MEFSKLITDIFLPFGGVSIVLIALATFLGNINTKRIVNGDLARYKIEFEAFKSLNAIALQSLKDSQEKEIQFLKFQQEIKINDIQNEFKTRFLKFEAYSAIAKERYQQLFDRRIKVYEEFLKIKNEINKSHVENAENIYFDDENPAYFANAIKEINVASQENQMLISNELAELSNLLFERSSKIFSSAKVNEFFAESQSDEKDLTSFERIMEAKNSELRKMFSECGELYEQWFEQLNEDVSKIRLILDTSGAFLK